MKNLLEGLTVGDLKTELREHGMHTDGTRWFHNTLGPRGAPFMRIAKPDSEPLTDALLTTTGQCVSQFHNLGAISLLSAIMARKAGAGMWLSAAQVEPVKQALVRAAEAGGEVEDQAKAVLHLFGLEQPLGSEVATR